MMVCWGQVSGIAEILMLSLDFHAGGGEAFRSNDSQGIGPVFTDEQTLTHLLPVWKGLFLCGVPPPPATSSYCRLQPLAGTS